MKKICTALCIGALLTELSYAEKLAPIIKETAGAELIDAQMQKIGEYERVFKYVRQKLFLSDNGYSKSLQEWLTLSYSVMREWDELFDHMALRSETMTEAEAETYLETLADLRHRAKANLAELLDRQLTLTESADIIAHHINRINALDQQPAVNRTDWAAQVGAMVEESYKLLDKINEYEDRVFFRANYIRNYTTEMDLIIEKVIENVFVSRDLTERFKSEMISLQIEKSEVRTLFSSYDDFEARHFSDPKSKFRIFAAKEGFERSLERLAQARIELSAMKQKGLKETAYAAHDRTLTNKESSLRSRLNSMNPDRRYHQYKAVKKFRQIAYLDIADDCKDRRYEKKRNCRLAYWLHRTPVTSYLDYSSDKLKALEYAWYAAWTGENFSFESFEASEEKKRRDRLKRSFAANYEFIHSFYKSLVSRSASDQDLLALQEYYLDGNIRSQQQILVAIMERNKSRMDQLFTTAAGRSSVRLDYITVAKEMIENRKSLSQAIAVAGEFNLPAIISTINGMIL